MVTWIRRKIDLLARVHAIREAMYYGGMADHAAAAATIMPKENEAQNSIPSGITSYPTCVLYHMYLASRPGVSNQLYLFP